MFLANGYFLRKYIVSLSITLFRMRAFSDQTFNFWLHLSAQLLGITCMFTFLCTRNEINSIYQNCSWGRLLKSDQPWGKKRIILKLVSFAVSDTNTVVGPFKIWFNNAKILGSYMSLWDYSSFQLLINAALTVSGCVVSSSSFSQNPAIINLFLICGTS